MDLREVDEELEKSMPSESLGNDDFKTLCFTLAHVTEKQNTV